MPHPRRSRPALRLAAVAAPLLAAACVAPQRSWEEGAVTPATPQRPTFSSNTATTAAGTVELEAGVARDPGDAFDLPVTLKYGVRHDAEAFVGFSPYRSVELPGDDGEGVGDVLLGWRQRVTTQSGERPSAAFQVALKLPTADEDEGLGSGEVDAFGAVIASLTRDETSATFFGQLGLLGEPDGSGIDHQEGLALALDRAVGGGAGVFGELAGVFTPERDDEQVFATLGGTWSPSAGVVLDAGVVIGLSDDAPDFQVLIGLTRNLGRIAGWALRLPRS